MQPNEKGIIEEEEVLYEGNPSAWDIFCSCSIFVLLLGIFIVIGTGGFGLIGLIFPVWISRSTRYKITNQRVSVIEGLFSREEHELDLLRVKDISLRKQNLREQSIELGTIRIVSTDKSTPTLTLRIRQADEWRDRLRTLVREAKKEAGVQYREEL